MDAAAARGLSFAPASLRQRKPALIRRTYRIAAIAGDGIGKEVLPQGLRVLEAAARRHDIGLQFTPIGWASGDWYVSHGESMPSDWREQLLTMDAIYLGATEGPARGETRQAFRREFGHSLNLRPARLFDGVPCPLAGRKPGDIDFVVVRGLARPSAGGVDDALGFAFDLARSRERRHLTVATGPSGGKPVPDEGLAAMARRYPDIVVDTQPIDALCARFVLQPVHFDVVFAKSDCSEVLGDLGPACTGTISLAPSADLNLARRFPSIFEPMHGSAPDIAGREIANPIATIWAGALMLDFLGGGSGPCREAHDAILRAIEAVLVEGPHTPDLGGCAATQDVGRAIAERVLG